MSEKLTQSEKVGQKVVKRLRRLVELVEKGVVEAGKAWAPFPMRKQIEEDKQPRTEKQ